MLNSIYKILVILPFLFTLSFSSKGQTIVSTPVFQFLTIRSDAQTIMVAGTLTGIPSTAPTAFFYNPAQLGNFGSTNSFALQFFPTGNTWFNDISLHSNSFTAGAKLKGLPLSFGFGYMNFGIDYGRVVFRTIENQTGVNSPTISARDYSNMFSIGVQLHTPVKLSVGYSFKKNTSRFYTVKTSGNAYDLGILASRDFNLNKVNIGFSLGYSIRNEGKNVDAPNLDVLFIETEEGTFNPYYQTNYSRKYSLPRNHVLGYGASIGLEDIFLNQERTIFQINWSAQTEESRYKFSDSGFLLSDTNISKLVDNMITGKGGTNLQNSQGLSLDILESLTLGWGQFYGQGFDRNITTYGFSLFTNPLLSFFLDENKGPISQFFFNHMDISYSLSIYSAEENPVLHETYISGLTIAINGF